MPPKRKNKPHSTSTPGPSADQAKAKFNEALALHQQGELAQAEAIYKKVLKLQPKHVDALHLLGVIAGQMGKYQLAADLIGKAIKIQPNNAAFYSNRGNVLHELKQVDAALARFDQAIAIKPDFVDAYYNRGIILQELKELDAAIASYDKAIANRPNFAIAYVNRGNALKELKQLDAAIASYDRGIAIKPDFADAYANRGAALHELKQLEAAVASYDKAIALKPDYAEAYFNRGNVLKELKQSDAAIASYDLAIAIQPDFVEAYSNRGVALQELNQMDAALASYDQAIALKPDYAEAYFNRGNGLKDLKQLKAAVASYDLAIAIQPDYVEAYSNRGVALQELNQMDAALASYDQTIALKPDVAEAYWNKSLALLVIGDFEKGWELFEWRWQCGDASMSPKRHFRQPLWLGKESISGKTILLHSEQGLGDTIQFCRYAKLVAQLGARVILEAPKPLLGLLKGLEGVAELVEASAPLPAFDVHCPLLSLPFAYKTKLDTIPTASAYLRSDPGKVYAWARRLGVKTKPRVGIVWSGSTAHKNDHNRSIPLVELVRHLPETCEYVSLQKEVREPDQATLGKCPQIKHYGAELNDFADTAALCELMDWVVCVDTSVAHLAGALGKPTWVLLPFNPDWRWLLDRSDSVWYPSMTLYRQSAVGDWTSVLAQIRADCFTRLVG